MMQKCAKFACADTLIQGEKKTQKIAYPLEKLRAVAQVYQPAFSLTLTSSPEMFLVCQTTHVKHA